jgi:hypothetical protein
MVVNYGVIGVTLNKYRALKKWKQGRPTNSQQSHTHTQMDIYIYIILEAIIPMLDNGNKEL